MNILKKKSPRQLKYFLGYWVPKTCLLKCRKGLPSENTLAAIVFTSLQNCPNPKKSTSILLSHRFLANFRWRKLFWLISGILGLLLKTLTANYDYSRNNTDNSPLPAMIQFSGGLKIFSWFWIPLFDSVLNFECFEKKINLIAQVFLRLLTPKDMFT